MVIGTHTIPFWKSEDADDDPQRLFLEDALAEFSRSRATRRLIQHGIASGIKSAMLVPLYNLSVRPGDLGRAIRKVMRTAFATLKPGDCFVVDLNAGSDGMLTVTATQRASLL